RFSRDWSSDVCSSDLTVARTAVRPPRASTVGSGRRPVDVLLFRGIGGGDDADIARAFQNGVLDLCQMQQTLLFSGGQQHIVDVEIGRASCRGRGVSEM